jgi:hypothetical protein
MYGSIVSMFSVICGNCCSIFSRLVWCGFRAVLVLMALASPSCNGCLFDKVCIRVIACSVLVCSRSHAGCKPVSIGEVCFVVKPSASLSSSGLTLNTLMVSHAFWGPVDIGRAVVLGVLEVDFTPSITTKGTLEARYASKHHNPTSSKAQKGVIIASKGIKNSLSKKIPHFERLYKDPSRSTCEERVVFVVSPLVLYEDQPSSRTKQISMLGTLSLMMYTAYTYKRANPPRWRGMYSVAFSYSIYL